MGEAPADTAVDDPTIPPGTIELRVQDGAGKPVGRQAVTLGIVFNSVAKGESRKRVTLSTDDLGVVRFTNLEIASGVSYRPTITRDGATFAVSPFGLNVKNGIRALLHVYPVTSDVEQALIVSQTTLYAEVKDDRIQLQQVFTLYNFSRKAWLPPTDTLMSLPPSYTAFAAQQGMSDVGVDAVEGKGVRLRGTIGPGQHSVEFKWQLPYTGDSEVKFDVGMGPHMAAARVIAPASKGMGMEVEGFDPVKLSTDGQGQRALITEKQLRREDPPLKSITVTIKGLPTEGPGKILATMLAFGGIVMGLVLGSRKPPPRDTKRERAQLLAALEGLELGHRDGSIGPKTYERARRELIDDLARTFAAEPKPSAAKSSAGKTGAAKGVTTTAKPGAGKATASKSAKKPSRRS
jgi:hypothetical protein